MNELIVLLSNVKIGLLHDAHIIMVALCMLVIVVMGKTIVDALK